MRTKLTPPYKVVARTEGNDYEKGSCKLVFMRQEFFYLGRSSQTHTCKHKDLSSFPRYCVKKNAGYGGAHLSTSSGEAERSLDLLDSKGSRA